MLLSSTKTMQRQANETFQKIQRGFSFEQRINSTSINIIKPNTKFASKPNIIHIFIPDAASSLVRHFQYKLLWKNYSNIVSQRMISSRIS